MRVALTIAASDSSSGAGIQLDLAVFREIGVYGVCAVTNVTAQNSLGVHKVNKVPPSIVAAQVDAVTRDFNVSACKIGMLYSPQTVSLVAERLSRREVPNVVLDPVMRAKNGEVLLTEPAIKRMKRLLIPNVALVTPNAEEARVLTGVVVADVATASEAAKALVEMGAGAALVKGGHIQGEAVDVLYDGADVFQFAGRRLDKTMHGTGCALSAAIAARLSLGDDLPAAVSAAKEHVTQAIENSISLGKGKMQFYCGMSGNS